MLDDVRIYPDLFLQTLCTGLDDLPDNRLIRPDKLCGLDDLPFFSGQ